MIRILKKNNLLYISGEPRTESELGNTELLYMYENLEWNEDIKNRVRPFKILGKQDEIYKLSLLNKLPDILYQPAKLEMIDQSRTQEILTEIDQVAQLLGLDKDIHEIPEITYTCDLWNYIDTLYPKGLNILLEYYELGKADKELIQKIYKAPGNLKKLDLARNSNWERIYNFLPEFIQENLAFFGSDVGIIRTSTETPEFRNQEKLGPKIPKLQDEIYKEFKLGEIFLDGAAVEVKRRLQKIYDLCEIKKTPKVKDLEEFFIIVPCWSRGKRGFRIDFRKL